MQAHIVPVFTLAMASVAAVVGAVAGALTANAFQIGDLRLVRTIAVFMMVLISVLDLAFGQAALWIFGQGDAAG